MPRLRPIATRKRLGELERLADRVLQAAAVRPVDSSPQSLAPVWQALEGLGVETIEALAESLGIEGEVITELAARTTKRR